MNVPDCGTAYVQYSKLCGNPLAPRTALTIDMTLSNHISTTIVQNGRLLNPSYFD